MTVEMLVLVQTDCIQFTTLQLYLLGSLIDANNYRYNILYIFSVPEMRLGYSPQPKSVLYNILYIFRVPEIEVGL